MNEQEWLTSTDPVAMLRWLRGSPLHPGANLPPTVESRKLRLFAVACCKRPEVWDDQPCSDCNATGYGALISSEGHGASGKSVFAKCKKCHGTGRVGGLDPRSRRAVEVAEWFADGGCNDTRNCPWFPDAVMTDLGYLQIAHREAGEALSEHPDENALLEAWNASSEGTDYVSTHFPNIPPATQAALLRCIFGNPWRQAAEISIWRSWLTPAALAIARTIYDDRRWEDMPILADALEEAGCKDATILNHCRQPAWHEVCCHARGCWVLDLVLGKN